MLRRPEAAQDSASKGLPGMFFSRQTVPASPAHFVITTCDRCAPTARCLQAQSHFYRRLCCRSRRNDCHRTHALSSASVTCSFCCFPPMTVSLLLRLLLLTVMPEASTAWTPCTFFSFSHCFAAAARFYCLINAKLGSPAPDQTDRLCAVIHSRFAFFRRFIHFQT